MKNPKRLALVLTGMMLVTALTWAQEPEKVYYRYTNEEGVTVMNDRIPPEYVSKGYEVVSLSGTVIRTVAPAPSEEEAERLAEERKLQAEQDRKDAELRRRYSSVSDVRAAKERRLSNLQGNISILESNLNNVRSQIKDLEARAASVERSGREVSDGVLDNLDSLSKEEQYILEQIEQREADYERLEETFDRDIERFKELTQENN